LYPVSPPKAFHSKGTAVSVVGSVDPSTSCTGSFTLDANATAFTFASPALSAARTHQTLFAAALLPDAPHTLTYTLAACAPAAPGYVWFDYLLYAPAANASTNGVVYFVDDTDARIAYSGNWTVEDDSDGDFGRSSRGGAEGAALQLDFEGTCVRRSSGRVRPIPSSMLNAQC
jgi:hypothetical protein